MKKQILSSILALTSFIKPAAAGTELKVGDSAPTFSLQTHDNQTFDLNARKGQWTVLYFYPKAETPGCTKQACAFRDNIKKITDQGAEVFGISVNTVDEQNKFHKKYKLLFSLLADDKGTVTALYGAKMPVINMSKRWTLIVGPDLKIKSFRKDVDPAVDAQKVADELAALKKSV